MEVTRETRSSRHPRDKRPCQHERDAEPEKNRQPVERIFHGLRRGPVIAAEDGILAGGALCLFPEGTRTLDGSLQKPKSGIGFLIMKAEVPVLPVYIEGSFKAFPKGAKGIRPAKITARYGALISQDEFKKLGSGKDIYEKAADLVMAKIAELKNI